jgi:hypothetical protein
LPNVEVITAFHAVIRGWIHRIVNLITAKNAVIELKNYRIWIVDLTNQEKAR